MAIKDKLISNTTYLGLNWVFNTLFFMFFWILLGKTIEPKSLGIVALSLQITTLLATLGLVGMGITVQKLISEMNEKKQKYKIQNLISFSLKVVLVSSLLFSGLFILVYNWFPSIFNLTPDVLWLVVVSIISMSFATILASVHYGYQNMKKIFLTTFFGDLVLIAFTILFLYLGLDYTGAILAFAFSNIAMFLTRIKPYMLKSSKKGLITRKDIFKFSIPAFVVVFFMVVFNNSQYIILSALQTAETVGIYAVGMKIISVIAILPTIFSNALFPITSSLSAVKNGETKQSYLISLVFRYTAFIVFPLALFMTVFSKYIVLFFSTPEYLGATAFLPILVFGAVFLGLATQLLSSLYAIGKPKKYRDSYIISTIVYVLTAIILTYYFSVFGLAASYLISSFVMFAVTIFFIRK